MLFSPSYQSDIFGIPPFLEAKRLLLISVQFYACIVVTFLTTCFVFAKFLKCDTSVWKKAIAYTSPSNKEIKNLEREEIIWATYIEWIDDYYNFYANVVEQINTVLENDINSVHNDKLSISEPNLIQSKNAVKYACDAIINHKSKKKTNLGVSEKTKLREGVRKMLKIKGEEITQFRRLLLLL